MVEAVEAGGTYPGAYEPTRMGGGRGRLVIEVAEHGDLTGPTVTGQELVGQASGP
jgi:hypothetical protein